LTIIGLNLEVRESGNSHRVFAKHMTDSGELVSVVAFGLNLTLAALAFLITQPLWRLRRWGRARRHPEVSQPGPS